MSDDDEFDRIVARNGDDIAAYILRRSRLRVLAWVAVTVLALTIAILVGTAVVGLRVTLIWLAIGVPLAALYGWKTWRP